MMHRLSKDGFLFSRNNLSGSLLLVRKWLYKTAWVTWATDGLILLAFTALVGRAYLNFDPLRLPAGVDVPHQVYNHIIWTWWDDCGACILWNGTLNGGDPSFANIQAATLHPLTILTTWLAGVTNGTKLMLLCTLFLGGAAQYTLARQLRLNRWISLWSALASILGPQYTAHMESGQSNILLATTSAALTLPVIFYLQQTGRKDRRAAALLALLLAGLLLSGQGYVQLVYFIGFLLVAAVFMLQSWRPLRFKPALTSLLQALPGAVLLAGLFLIPMLHFLPHFSKATNAGLNFALALSEIPRRLVVNDPQDMMNSVFIGWPVLLMAAAGLAIPRNEHRRMAVFCAVSAGIVLVMSSENFLQWLHPLWAGVEALRYNTMFSGLAMPFLFALSALGLDGIVTRAATVKAAWKPLGPVFRLSVTAGLSVLALYGLGLLQTINNQWFYLNNQNFFLVYQQEAQALRTETLEWVSGFPRDYQSAYYLMQSGFKQVRVNRPWYWSDRNEPQAFKQLQGADTDDPITSAKWGYMYNPSMSQYSVVESPGNAYSQVTMPGSTNVCAAEGLGGHLRVACENSHAGVLTLQENSYPGWRATMDGKPIPLLAGDVLQVTAPAGSHTYTFVYDPWDVKAGGLCLLAGLGYVAWLVWGGRKKQRGDQPG
ncbi:MAG TPA: hypothetical protein PKD23_07595 [Bellilinea sp.]|nr:hypothetical protein [Bellilinea sp.]